MIKNKNNKISKSLRNQYIYSILSVSIALSMLGSIIFIITSVRSIFDEMKEQANIIVEFSEMNKVEIDAFVADLKTKTYFKPNSIEIIKKEEALEKMKQEIGSELSELGMDNPFYDILTFNIHSQYITKKNLALIRAELIVNPIVQAVNYQELILENVAQNVNRIILVITISGIFFIILSIYLLHNTMKLSLMTKRFSVRTMQLVGATPNFISKPFIKSSIWIGVLGATLACIIIIIIFIGFIKFVPNLESGDMYSKTAVVILCVFIFGVLITGLSSYFIINRILRYKTDELYTLE